MGNLQIPSELHFVKGLDPVADAFAGTVYSDVVEVAGQGIGFIIYKGVGATGTSTITVNACNDAAASTESAVEFFYKRISTTDSGWTAATTAGFTTTAGSSDVYHIVVPADKLASVGYGYARLVATESVDSAVLGGILCYVYGGRFAPQPTSLID